MIVKPKLTGKKDNSNLLFSTYLIYIENNNTTNKKNGHCVGVYCIVFHCVAFHCIALAFILRCTCFSVVLQCVALAFALHLLVPTMSNAK